MTSNPTSAPDEPAPDERLDVLALSRYLAGDSHATERSVVEQWLAGNPERMGILRAMQDPRPSIGDDAATHEQQATIAHAAAHAAWIEYRDQRLTLHDAKKSPRQSRRTSTTDSRRRTLRSVGIGMALMSMIALAIFLPTWRTPSVSGTTAIYATRAGQWSTIRLADGSMITLAPVTTARVAPGAISIDGEAAFIVASKPGRAFTVRTENAVVQVLGTAFTVRQYASEQNSRVVVEDGRVSLRSLSRAARESKSAPAILAAGMLATVTDSSVAVTSGIVVSDYTGWTQGRLVFDATPLREVVAELGRAYGVEIRIADAALRDQRVTLVATVSTQSLSQILDFISRASDAHYVRIKDAYLLAPGRMPTMATPVQRPTRFLPQEQQYGR